MICQHINSSNAEKVDLYRLQWNSLLPISLYLLPSYSKKKNSHNFFFPQLIRVCGAGSLLVAEQKSLNTNEQ